MGKRISMFYKKNKVLIVVVVVLILSLVTNVAFGFRITNLQKEIARGDGGNASGSYATVEGKNASVNSGGSEEGKVGGSKNTDASVGVGGAGGSSKGADGTGNGEGKSKATEGNLNNKLFQEYYSKKLKGLFSDEDLKLLASKQWGCKLMVNGNEIGGLNSYVKAYKIRITLAEFKKSNEDLLPDNIMKMGTLIGGDSNDSLEDNIQVISGYNFTKNMDKQSDGTKINYDFGEVKSGTFITIKISEMLKFRLGLKDKIPDSELRVVVN